MLAGSVLLFLISSPTLEKAGTAIQTTLQEIGTWEVVLAMYFVMCLEHLLRTTGIIKGFMTSMKPLLRSERVLLAFMPAFLGLLPSLGGAIFSAPMVEQASKKYSLSPEKKATINYWFRHVWEYGNPIIPGVLLASQITAIPLGTFVANMIVYTLIALLLGVGVILTGKGFQSVSDAPNLLDNNVDSNGASADSIESKGSLRYFFLGVGPILVNIILVVAFGLSAALSMGIVVLGMAIHLRFTKGQLITMLQEAFEKKILWGVLSYFIFPTCLNCIWNCSGAHGLFSGDQYSRCYYAGDRIFDRSLAYRLSPGSSCGYFPYPLGILPGKSRDGHSRLYHGHCWSHVIPSSSLPYCHGRIFQSRSF